jgi:2-succinyl-5-enolpyruvyl-6-hydroxy-3-cyclohexene-1-carboxylate synthase
MRRDANTAFARTLVDEWVRAGVQHACVAPGSRNAPLALALVEDGRLRVHVHLDERSAAFFALGCARASGQPAVVCCTSGTAAAHLHAAVLEAAHGRVPLLVCTADRPPELRDTGAGQTINQVGLYGDTPRWSIDVEAPTDRAGIGPWWRSLAARAASSALGPPAGPVHLNLAFREPLAPTGAELVDAPGRVDGRPWTVTTRPVRTADAATVERLAQTIRDVPKGLVVAGWGSGLNAPLVTRFARASGWPILADALSGLRACDGAVSAYDAMLRVDEFAATHRPDLVLRVGAPSTSAALIRWLADVDAQWLLDPDHQWLDPGHTATDRIAADPSALLDEILTRLPTTGPGSSWARDWHDADGRARDTITEQLDGSEEPFEGRIARDVVAALPALATLVVGSSMPVRDVETFAEPRPDVRVIANRGVNGIDGFASTTLGVAAASRGAVVGLTGDLSFLHDTNGLLGAPDRGLDATLVVVDNGGGGIFSFLPYQDQVAPEHFERVFATPPAVDVADIARTYGLAVSEVEKASDLAPAVREAIAAGGVRMVRVRTDRGANVGRHREVFEAVAAALRPN